MTEVEFDPAGERPTAQPSRREIREAEQRRLRAEATDQQRPQSRRDLREKRRRGHESTWSSAFSAVDNELPSAPEASASAPRSRREARLAAASAVSSSAPTFSASAPAANDSASEVSGASRPATRESATGRKIDEGAPQSWSFAAESEVDEAHELSRAQIQEQATETAASMPVATPLQAEPADVPVEISVDSRNKPVLSASSLFAFDDAEMSEAEATSESRGIPQRSGLKPEQLAATPAFANTADTAPNRIVDQWATGPQPRLVEKKSGGDASPEHLRRTRATTLRGKRPVATAPTHPPRKPRRKRGAVLRKVAASGILLFAGAFVVATTVPAQALGLFGGSQGGGSVQTSTPESPEVQSVSIPDNVSQLEFMIDGDVTVQDALESARLSSAAVAQIQTVADASTSRASGYMNGVVGYEEALQMLETSYIQHPFPEIDDVPISSGFEWRWGTVHEGIDFIPGAGTPIRPMANGVVTNVEHGTNAGGYMVTVDHMIDGKRYQTVYAHMIAGSIQVREGEVVTIDTVLGQVGSTGFSTGPHLHFEIRLDNSDAVDPIQWMQNRSEYTSSEIGQH